MIHQDHIEIATRGRGIYDATGSVRKIIRESGIETGLAHVFIHHTSASLMLTENADPDVHRDLEAFMSRLVPDGDPIYHHTMEGPDDMSAHVRSVLTQTGLSIPVIQSNAGLGTWQGLYVWEHRTMAHHRRLTVTVQGE